MKILTTEEIDAHWYATATGGFKGLTAGLLVSGAIFKLGARKYPGFPKKLPWSIRSAIFIFPPTIGTTIWAEEASNSFDRETYSGDYNAKEKINEYKQWSKLPLSQKLLNGLIDHKYKIIVGSWAASMYGSWVLVNKDKIMTKSQKIVQARMYAQFLTVILLLGSIGLSLYDEKIHPENYEKRELPSWQKVLKEEENRISKEEEKKNTSYQRTRIYKD